jgi:hypothetical protein
LETEGAVPQAHYAFDQGVLTVDLPRLIARGGQHWGSAIECGRPSNWRGQWRRVAQVAAEFRGQHPASCRPGTVKGRHGAEKPYWVFTKGVRWKKYGEQRLVIASEQEDRQDAPRCFVTDAK